MVVFLVVCLWAAGITVGTDEVRKMFGQRYEVDEGVNLVWILEEPQVPSPLQRTRP